MEEHHSHTLLLWLNEPSAHFSHLRPAPPLTEGVLSVGLLMRLTPEATASRLAIHGGNVPIWMSSGAVMHRSWPGFNLNYCSWVKRALRRYRQSGRENKEMCWIRAERHVRQKLLFWRSNKRCVTNTVDLGEWCFPHRHSALFCLGSFCFPLQFLMSWGIFVDFVSLLALSSKILLRHAV